MAARPLPKPRGNNQQDFPGNLNVVKEKLYKRKSSVKED